MAAVSKSSIYEVIKPSSGTRRDFLAGHLMQLVIVMGGSLYLITLPSISKVSEKALKLKHVPQLLHSKLNIKVFAI